MRVFWDHTPATGEIHMRDATVPGMQVWSDNRVCRLCGAVDHRKPLNRPRWQKHKGGRFYPHLAPLPPDGKPLIGSPMERGKYVRIRDFLTAIARKIRPAEVTPTGQPKGFLWVFFRLAHDVTALPGTREAGTFLDLSPYYVPKLRLLSRAEWRMSKAAPDGFPHNIIIP
jgi:hypothetical protein